ncbi:MAG: NUDIX domain-containing protein [Nocardioides sp.]
MTLHADALALLEGWRAPDAAQERLRLRYVEHLHAHPDAMTRGCRPDHITASTLVLNAQHDAVLLTLHAKARAWFQFGGHCEPEDTTLAGAALREAIEESGLTALTLDPEPVQLSEHAVPFCGPTGDVHHLDVRFVAVAAPGAGHAVSEESLDVRWWSAETLRDSRADPGADLVELVELSRARCSGAGRGGPPSTSR